MKNNRNYKMLVSRLLTLLLISTAALHPWVASAETADLSSAPGASRKGGVLWKAPATVTLPIEEAPSKKTIDIPAVDGGGKNVALRFRARFDWSVVGGVSRSLALSLNDKPFSPSVTPVLNRLAFEFEGKGKSKDGWWVRRDALFALTLHISPDANSLEPRVLSAKEEGQWYLIDVTQLLISGEPSKLELTNLAIMSDFKKAPKSTVGIVIEDLSIVKLD